jgi:uncharacterized protein
MKMNKAIGYFSVFFSLLSFCAVAQEAHRVHLISTIQKGAIVLRIAPATSVDWEEGNTYGYIVERFTVFRKNEFLTDKEKKTFHLKALPLKDWEKIADKDDFAAIAAQAIYGDDFEVSNSMNNDIVQAYQKTEQRETRFGFALFSADLSAETARAAGLYLRDSLVREDERYLYRAYLASPAPKDTALVYVQMSDYFPLPRVTDIKIQFLDRVVTMQWNVKELHEYYTAYWIERSDDGINFKKTSSLPFINFNTKDNGRNLDTYVWTDSLVNNEKKYYFRIKGVTPFAEEGPPSDVLQGQGYNPVKIHPTLYDVIPDAKKGATLNWKFPAEYENTLSGFEIERSVKSETKFVKISPLLLPHTRTYTDGKPLSTNYYKVTAIGRNGDRITSFPVLYQPQDSVPPAAPDGLIASVDNAGLVKLSWKQNTELDFLGYRIFRSNFRNAEFSQITISPTDTTFYVDTISLDNLTSNIYYKLQAIDNRFNPSQYSAPIKLRKPDVLKPVQPVLRKITVNDNSIEAEWRPSSSFDVQYHQLWIRDSAEHIWRPGKTFNSGTVLGYQYTDLKPGIYALRMEAVDSSKNSVFSESAFAILISSAARKPVSKIETKVDRENKFITLSWDYQEPGLKKIVIYRAKENDALMLYKTVVGVNQFTDGNLEMNTSYKYILKAQFVNGDESPFSKQVEVKY